MSTIYLSSRFEDEELAYEIAESFDWQRPALIKFVALLDAEYADSGATLELIQALADIYAEATDTIVHINIMENSK